MSIIGYDPDFRSLERSVNRIFDDFFLDLNVTPRSRSGRSASSLATPGVWAPSVDVTETDKDLVIHAELPGVPKDKVKLDIRDNHLIISGNHEENQDYNQGSARVRERRYGAFSRTIPLPHNVKTDDTQAKFDQGVLEVCVPKTEVTEGKKITIQ